VDLAERDVKVDAGQRLRGAELFADAFEAGRWLGH
jgi:hypothetical protein